MVDLYVFNADKIQVGISAFETGDGCAVQNESAVLTPVSQYREWIDAAVCFLSADPPAGCDPSAHNNFDTSKCFDFDTCGGGNGDGGGPVACFSKDATVQVETKGTVSMEELQPGDRVMTSNGSFESIYAFGHRSSSHVDKFFKIYIENSERPFEMTSEDLIYTKDGAVAVAVRTDTVKIGDILSSLERPSK